MKALRVFLSAGLLALSLAAAACSQQSATTSARSGYSGYTGAKLTANQLEALRQRVSLQNY